MDGRLEDVLTKNPHPLLIPAIVTEVTQYLDIYSLRHCRHLCRQWNEECVKRCRVKGVLLFHTDEHLREVVALSRQNARLKPEESILGPDITFKIGPIISLSFRSIPSRCDPIVEEFWTEIGPMMTSLFLHNSNWNGADLKCILYSKAPNLRELSLLSIVVGRIFVDGEVISSTLTKLKDLRVSLIWSNIVRNTEMMTDLLRISPNLTGISWLRTKGDDNRYDRNFQRDLEQAFSTQPLLRHAVSVRDTIFDLAIHDQTIRLDHLTRVDCNMRLNNESVLALTAKNFPLVYVDLTLTYDVQTCHLVELLESLSNTLVQLKLEFHPSDKAKCLGDLSFPHMKSLKHLLLHRFKGSFAHVIGCSSKLTSVTFQESDFVQLLNDFIQSREVERILPVKTLNTLQLYSDLSKYNVSSKWWGILGKLIPNLTHLGADENFVYTCQKSMTEFFKLLRYTGPATPKWIGDLGFSKPDPENPLMKRRILF